MNHHIQMNPNEKDMYKTTSKIMRERLNIKKSKEENLSLLMKKRLMIENVVV